jgi:predicted nucleotidyltransferase component of viral defense system
VGDVIIPGSEKRKIPRLLEDFTEPEINTYSLESTIAEKLDAIIQRLELTSRMKDFYDIYYLSHTFDFDGRRLRDAIFETLRNRDTRYNQESLDAIKNLVNDHDIQTRWKQFVRLLKMPELNLSEVLKGIGVFLDPVWSSIIQKTEITASWSAKKYIWGS